MTKKTHGYYVCHKFVCTECSYTNENDVLVFAESEEQARDKLVLSCNRCMKPVVTSHVILGIREARWLRSPDSSA